MHSCVTSKNVKWCHLIWPTRVERSRTAEMIFEVVEGHQTLHCTSYGALWHSI